jgi:hypothetical protein
MALSMAHDFSIALPARSSRRRIQSGRPRRITAQAGHALEILGHAVEYLTDEFVHDGIDMSAHNARVEAVQILMSLNREVYFECPQISSLGDRLRTLLGLQSA